MRRSLSLSLSPSLFLLFQEGFHSGYRARPPPYKQYSSGGRAPAAWPPVAAWQCGRSLQFLVDFSLNYFRRGPRVGGPKLALRRPKLARAFFRIFCAHAAEVRHDSVCPGHLLTHSRCPGTRDLGSRPERLTVLPLVRAAPNVVRIHGRHGWQKALWLRPGSPTGTFHSSSLL